MLWHTVTESNCVAARRGGEQLEVNDQSVTQVNSIRLDRCGEPAGKRRSPNDAWPLKGGHSLWSGKPGRENPRDLSGRRLVVGVGMIGSFDDMKRGALDGIKPVFTLVEPKSRPSRSQSTHSSEDAG